MLEQFTPEPRALELQPLTSPKRLEVASKPTVQAHSPAKIKVQTSSQTSQPHQTEGKQLEVNPLETTSRLRRLHGVF